MMVNWKELTVGDLCDTISDTYHRNDDEVVLVNTSDVLEGKILNHQLVENKNLKGQFKKTFKKDDILYSEIRPANKRYAYVDFAETERYIASTKLMVLRPNKEVVLPRFLFAFLSSSYVLTELQHLAETRSGTFPQITFSSELAPMPIALPDFETQEKIVEILSSIEGKIQNNNAINENLLQQAKAILTAFFIDFSHFGGKVPTDWEQGSLQDIVDFSNGYAFKSKELLDSPTNDCYHVFKQGHINRGGGFNSGGTKSWYPISKCANLFKYILRKGDVLMAMTDMKDNVAILGNTALMTVDNQYILNQRVGLLRSNGYRSTSYAYIYLLTNSFDFLKDLRSRANSGVQVNLSSAEIKASPVWIATDAVNKEFNSLTEPLLTMIMANDIENQKLAKIRDALLPRLMSGELDVSSLAL